MAGYSDNQIDERQNFLLLTTANERRLPGRDTYVPEDRVTASCCWVQFRYGKWEVVLWAPCGLAYLNNFLESKTVSSCLVHVPGVIREGA